MAVDLAELALSQMRSPGDLLNDQVFLVQVGHPGPLFDADRSVQMGLLPGHALRYGLPHDVLIRACVHGDLHHTGTDISRNAARLGEVAREPSLGQAWGCWKLVAHGVYSSHR